MRDRWLCFDLGLKLLYNVKCSHCVYSPYGKDRCAQHDAHVKHCVDNDLKRVSRAKHKHAKAELKKTGNLCVFALLAAFIVDYVAFKKKHQH